MATCFGQDGNPDSTYVPCNQTAVIEGSHTACCKKGETCLANGLCRPPTVDDRSNYYWLEGCTDKTFNDPACSIKQKCRDGDNLFWKCFGQDDWCCNGGDPPPVKSRNGHINTTCCTISDLMFTAPSPIKYTIADQMRLPVSTLLFNSESSTDQTSTPTPTPAPTTGAQPSSATSATATPTHDISLNETTNQSPSTSSHKTSVGVGVGVGVGLGIIALSVAFYFLLQRRKRRQHGELKGDEISEMPSPSPRYELYGNEAANEAVAEKTRYEMRA